MANVIDAIYHLTQNPITQITSYYQGRNRANNAGDALEEYVKDLFCNTFALENTQERLRVLQDTFSYLGNNSNPPDMLLRGGDAIEVKKIESDNASLALNSSYPKQTLLSSSSMISSACKAAENWSKRDMLYVVGVVDRHPDTLKHLCMVYGLDYCASDECYRRIKKTIKDGVESIPHVEFSESRELGHINRVDPLGITYMRVRGMWGIKNPWTAFDYVYQRNEVRSFNFMCLINDEKWDSFHNKNLLLQLDNADFRIENVEIRNPDNPAQLRGAKLIRFVV